MNIFTNGTHRVFLNNGVVTACLEGSNLPCSVTDIVPNPNIMSAYFPCYYSNGYAYQGEVLEKLFNEGVKTFNAKTGLYFKEV